MVNGRLKTLENMVELLYNELKVVSQDPSVSTKSYDLLKESYVDCINLKRKIESARGWNTQEAAK